MINVRSFATTSAFLVAAACACAVGAGPASAQENVNSDVGATAAAGRCGEWRIPNEINIHWTNCTGHGQRVNLDKPWWWDEKVCVKPHSTLTRLSSIVGPGGDVVRSIKLVGNC